MYEKLLETQGFDTKNIALLNDYGNRINPRDIRIYEDYMKDFIEARATFNIVCKHLGRRYRISGPRVRQILASVYSSIKEAKVKEANRVRAVEESGTRLFFVVDSIENNEEIFETLEQAQAFMLSGMNSGTNRRIRACIVRNAYKEEDLGTWNYDDEPNTFETIKLIEEEI